MTHETDETQSQKPSDEALAAARVFASKDGRAVMAHLRKHTIGRTVGPDKSDAELRDMEGQRALFKRIENLIEAGEKNHE